ncbi:DUF3352 domain-containing protein [Serinicoccus kebangsaanensis]|uniref:DUF3352 domain-containing protein n=1 Tax=Serinicoccus kebangsaanensis TaxID=2602069 RepID=UPI00124CE6FF|nr:DUF3352 domain-containing protein [Serinicoccus kebangsaanensis]
MTSATETTADDVTEGGRKTPWLLIGGGVAAAAVIGGGTAAALMMGGGGDRPDSVLPGEVAAYAQIDLDPAAGQKVAAVRFFQGLDSDLEQRLADGEWREWVWEQIEAEGEVPADLSFEEDIEPWLGDRAGLAMLPAGEGEEPAMAVALQVKDGDAAIAFLDEHLSEEADEVGYYLEGDYVVFSQASTLDAVRSAAEAGSLADNESFTSDMEALGEAGIMAMWADMSMLDDIDPSSLNPSLEMTEEQLGMGAEQPEITGRVAATVRLTPDAIEMHGVSRDVAGVEMSPAGETDSLITQLPADTAVALSLESGSSMVQSMWDYYSEDYSEQLQEAAAAAEAEGFSLPDDLKVALGESMSLAVGPDIVGAVMNMSQTDPSVPALPLAYRVTTDTERAQQLLNDNGMGAGVLVTREDDGTLTLGTDQSYVDRVAEGGGDTLGDSDLFTRAVADAADAQSTFYVDVAPFEEFYLPQVTDEKARTALEKLAAIGVSNVVEEGGDGRFTMRMVADEE